MIIDVAAKVPPSRVDLNTLEAVAREMGRIYRQCKAGQRDVREGAKLTYMLQCVAQVISDSVIEKRLDALENVPNEQGAIEGEAMSDAQVMQTAIEYEPVLRLANGT